MSKLTGLGYQRSLKCPERTNMRVGAYIVGRTELSSSQSLKKAWRHNTNKRVEGSNRTPGQSLPKGPFFSSRNLD